jgi:hypothetical protein
MECVEGVEGESTLGSCGRRWEETESQKLNIFFRASRCVTTSTKLNADGVDTREIDDDEAVLNGTRERTFQAVVTKLGH